MQCPGCGRPISFEEKYAKVVACNYCNSILEFGQGELLKVGEQGDFIEFPSIFSVGKVVNFKGKQIQVKGQLRFEYDGGFFDNFYVQINGNNYYIREDDGGYCITQELDATENSINLVANIAGSTLNYESDDYYIEEVGIFTLTSIKGYVNTKIIPGKEYEYLTGVNKGKKYFFEKSSQENILRISKEIEQFNK